MAVNINIISLAGQYLHVVPHLCPEMLVIRHTPNFDFQHHVSLEVLPFAVSVTFSIILRSR